MQEIIKICKVHGELQIDQVYHYPYAAVPACKKCVNRNGKKYRDKNKDKIAIKNKNYMSKPENKVIKNLRQRVTRDKNRAIILTKRKLHRKNKYAT